MSTGAPTYDLVMLLDPEAEDDARAKPLADARSAIESQGELLRHDDWGSRALQYPIQRRSAAEYHLLQFHAGSPQLLDSLEHSLRIIDGILRFRIIKLKPGVPEAPDMRAAPSAPRRSEDEPAREPSPGPAPDVQREPAAEAPQEPAAEVQQEPAPEPAPEGQQDATAQQEPASAEPAVEVDVEVGDRT
jgi:ribosomal protein S6